MARTDKGFIYIWALYSIAIFGIVSAGIGHVWQTKVQREKERELLFVGEQFRKAIMSYYNDAANGPQQYPESLQDLLIDRRSSTPKRHLRKIFLDPMTNSYEWGLIKESVSEQAAGINLMDGTRIIGVYSRSKKVPIKVKNFPDNYAAFTKAESYQDWQFFYVGVIEDNQSSQSQSDSPSSKSLFSSGTTSLSTQAK